MKPTFCRALVLAGLLCTALPGQEVRSTILGRVLDPQQSAVVGAAVEVTNTDTNVVVRVVTNETGYYEANFLLPGPYQVKASAPGFSDAVRQNIDLRLRARLEVNVQMSIGAVTETVLVTAAAPLLETADTSSGRVLDNRSLADLPAFYNNSMDLMRFTPGAFSSGQNAATNALHATGGAVDVTMAGGVGNNTWSLDGAPNLTRGGASISPAYSPHIDTLQEVKIETYNFDASVGHTTGINVTMLTKLGTNQFHGTASNQHWQQRWNGTPFFTKQLYYRNIAAAEAAGNSALAASLRSQDKQQSGHSNNFGFTLGGPVIIPKVLNGKDKLFFFFSYNGAALRTTETPSSLNHTVPTLAERQGDFSQLLRIDASGYQLYDPLSVRADPARPGHYIRDPIAGNILPKSRIINPVLDWYGKLLPTPNNDPLSATQEARNNYVATATPNRFDYTALTNRVDYHLSDKHRFFGRWIWWDWDSDRVDWTYETRRGFRSSMQYWRDKGATVDWVYMMSSATVLNVTAADNVYGTGNRPSPAARVRPSEVGLPKYMDDKAGNLYMAPSMMISGYDTLGPMQNGYPTYSYYRAPSAKATLSHIRGPHTISGGFDFRAYFRTQTAAGNTSGNFTFNQTYLRRNDDGFTPTRSQGFGWAAFLMGLPSTATVVTPDSVAAYSPSYGWYVQDNWRATPKLSLNFGLRLDYEQGPTERFDRMLGAFNPSIKLPISDAATVAYAASPVPELPANAFSVRGGSVYVGSEGASRKLWQNELMWQPRFGAAYQLTPKTVVRGGYGIYHDILSAWTAAPNQLGYSRTTTTSVSTDFGQTWLAGNPAAGISPMTDPFPIRSDGSRYDMPVRNLLGSMAVAGTSFTYNDPEARRTRQQRWRIGVQRQIGPNMVVEAAYAGAYSDRVYVGGAFNDSLSVSQNLNALPEEYWATGQMRNDAVASNLTTNVKNPFSIANFASLATENPLVHQNLSSSSFFRSGTIGKATLLRPFPHMTGLTKALIPAGKVRTDELNLSFERRFARGLGFNFMYTRLRNRSADYFHNEFDAEPAWREGRIGRPHRFAATGIVELPFGRGRAFLREGIPSALLGGFQVSLSYEWQPGPLINFGNLFYYGDLEEIRSDSPTLGQWFNTAGFERTPSKGPASYHVRVFPTRVDGVRADMTNLWNANIQREFRIAERVALQLRAEGINLSNRSLFAAPDTNPFSTNFGKVTSQTPTYNRFLQFQARIRF